MRMNDMKTTILSALLFLFLSPNAHAQDKPTRKLPPPFTSSEKFEYVAEKTDPLIGLIKSNTFQGVILRPDSSMESLRLIDDHLVPLDKVKSLDEKSCRQALALVLGPSEGEDPAIKVNKIETFSISTGPACEVEASEVKSSMPVLKRYRVVIGLHKGKVRALVAQDKSAVAPPDESAELRGFLKSLK